MALDDDDVPPLCDDYNSIYFSAPRDDYQHVLASVNSRIVRLPDTAQTINWEETDRWRRQGIAELPHPPQGQQYIFDPHSHLVSLVSCTDPTYAHERRDAAPAIDYKGTMGRGIGAHLAEKRVREKELIRQALAQTRIEVATRKRLEASTKRASASRR